MMAMLLGKKIGMTQVYAESGEMMPVTVILAGPCIVTQIKTIETDGYNAVQMGFEDIKESRRKMPAKGHCAKAKTVPQKFVRELRLDSEPETAIGEKMTVEVFELGQKLDVIGVSKGKGFAGTMKRHNFGGFPASHGTKRKHRAPGSISSFASDAGHGGNLKKGKKMAGHMGHVRVSSRNHHLVSIDVDKNLLVVKGSVPGPAGGYVMVRNSL